MLGFDYMESKTKYLPHEFYLSADKAKYFSKVSNQWENYDPSDWGIDPEEFED